MGVQVAFVYADWVTQFPEFAYLTEAQATEYFDWATTYVRNDGGGPCTVTQLQTQMLYLVTAHLVKLFAPTNTGQPGSGTQLVGRVSSAGEGSVNVSAEYAGPQAAAFWLQTQYGAAFWQMSAVFRTMRYIPLPRYGPNAPRSMAGPLWSNPGWGGGGWGGW